MRQLSALFGFLFFTTLTSALTNSSGASTLESRECRAESVELRRGDFSVQILAYKPLETSRRGTVLILPPTGGTNFIDRSYGRKLCAAGFDALILSSWTQWDEMSLDLGIHERLYQRAQKAIGMVLDSIPSGEFIGILGTSIGGIYAAVAASLWDRISAAFTIVAGGNLAHVIAHSDLDVIVQAHDPRFRRYGFRNDAEYEAALDEAIQLDPAKLPQGFRGKHLGMVIATADHTVPTVDQLVLEQRWKPEVEMRLPNSHRVAVVKTWLFHSKEVKNFFLRSVRYRRN